MDKEKKRGSWAPPLNKDGTPCLKGRIINLIQVVVVTQLLIVAATIHGCLTVSYTHLTLPTKVSV